MPRHDRHGGQDGPSHQIDLIRGRRERRQVRLQALRDEERRLMLEDVRDLRWLRAMESGIGQPPQMKGVES